MTRHPLKTAAACGLLAFAVATAGCGVEQVAPELAVIDHTGSSVAGSTALCAQQLIAYAQSRFVALDGKRGELRTDLFDSTTAGEPTFPARESFDVPAKDQSNPTKSVHVLDGKLKDFEDQLAQLQLQAGPSSGGTDVVKMLTSLGDAARAIKAKRIWICSDVADNRLPNPLTLEGVQEVLSTLHSEQAMPDLQGISVIVDTTSLRGRVNFSAAELTALRAFTEQLIAQSGGNLAAYGPGAGVS